MEDITDADYIHAKESVKTSKENVLVNIMIFILTPRHRTFS